MRGAVTSEAIAEPIDPQHIRTDAERGDLLKRICRSGATGRLQLCLGQAVAKAQVQVRPVNNGVEDGVDLALLGWYQRKALAVASGDDEDVGVAAQQVQERRPGQAALVDPDEALEVVEPEHERRLLVARGQRP